MTSTPVMRPGEGGEPPIRIASAIGRCNHRTAMMSRMKHPFLLAAALPLALV